MYHLVNNYQDKSGNALPGYYVKLKIPGGAYATLYADESETPIVSVSGVANTAVTDANGLFDLYVADGTYDIEFYDRADSSRRISTIPGVPMYTLSVTPEDITATLTARDAVVAARDETIIARDVTITASDDASTALTGSQSILAEVTTLRDETEGLRDAAITGAIGTYADTTAGLAAVAEGEYFQVPAADPLGYIDLYQDVAGVATLIDTLPNASAIAERFAPSSEPAADEDNVYPVVQLSSGGVDYVPFGVQRYDGRAVVAPPDDGTARFWGAALTPFFGREKISQFIRFLPWNGQSWTVGSGVDPQYVSAENPAYLTTVPWNDFSLMFNGGNRNKNAAALDPARVAEFLPAVERWDPFSGTWQGETPCSGTMAQFHQLQRMGGGDLDLLLSKSHGRGNTSLADLGKTPAAGYYSYANGLVEVAAAIELAARIGKTVYCPHIFWQQGEADYLAGTTKAAYKTAMIQLLTDYRSDWGPLLAAQYASHPTLRMLIGQLAAPTSGIGSQIMIAHEELARENPNDFTLVGPWYFLEIGPGAHPTAAGYALMGEYFARASYQLETTGAYTPCWLDNTYGTNGVSRSGTTVTVKVVSPNGDLALDTTSLPAFTKDYGAGAINTYGFRYYDGGGTEVAIVSVSLSATDTITITLASDTAGTLRYAYDGENLGGGRPGSWGNFRDGGGTLSTSALICSRTDPSRPMYNWLVTFERAVA